MPVQNRSHHHQYIGAHASRRRGLSVETVRYHIGVLQPGDDDGETAERPSNAYPVSGHLGFESTLRTFHDLDRYTFYSETTIDKHKVSVQRLRLQDYEQHHCDKEVLIQSCKYDDYSKTNVL